MTTGDGIDFGRFEALTFDCYGTLIDWETGLLAALHELLGPAAARIERDALLEAYARYEAEAEHPPFRTYRDVLAVCGRGMADELGVAVDDAALARFGGSVADWPAFPDSSAALQRLHTSFRLGVLTNCDDDLFAESARRLGVEFDWVVTAEAVRSYKPARAHFDAFFERSGLRHDQVLHVAQSLYHDHVPAKMLGMTTVWIDRRHGQVGHGATPAAIARPDLVFPDMASFAAAAVHGG